MNLDHHSSIVLEIGSSHAMNGVARSCTSCIMFSRINRTTSNSESEEPPRDANGCCEEVRIFSALDARCLRTGVIAITCIAVKERTHEIGTRRVLGATAGEIFFQVACEIASSLPSDETQSVVPGTAILRISI